MSRGMRDSWLMTSMMCSLLTSPLLRLVDLDFDRSRVQPADDLVGQVKIANVARRHLKRRLDGFVGNRDRVIAFEARAHADDYLARIFDRRLVNFHEPESARKRFVFGDVLLVLGHRRRADDANLAARERRLEHIGRVGTGSQSRSCADDRVRFVDEEDQIVALFDFVDYALNALFEHAAQHRAGDDARHLKLNDVRVAQALRHAVRLQSRSCAPALRQRRSCRRPLRLQA